MSKRWKIKDELYLEEHWGQSLSWLSKHLNHSKEAIMVKAGRLGLKDRTLRQEEISFCQFTKILNLYSSYKSLLKKLEQRNFPFCFYKKEKQKIRMVNLNKFFSWYKNNLQVINIGETNKDDFGLLEPDWLLEKRKADKRASVYVKRRRWTPQEDNRLISMLNSYRYGYRGISIELKRTCGAIKRRMLDLGLKQRPLRTDDKNWTQEEINKVKELYAKGYEPCVMQEMMYRSELSIQSMLERINNEQKVFKTK